MKTVFFVLTWMTFVYTVRAQTRDTLIYAEGRIINAATKEPINARITYQSLPYGSKVGFLSGSTFSFPLYDNEKYSITVEANGFAPSKYMLDPASANSVRRVIKDIELGLPAAAAVAAETTQTPGKVMRLDNLIFKVSTATISDQSYPELDQVANMLHDNPRMIIQLEGHTDSKGDPKLNMKLSEKRVVAVKDYLILKGAAKSKIKTKAFGGTMPLSLDNSEEAHKLNRRVEVRILEN
jgi:outer membrane protein OmpA-like peptidoglycan-associated protein